MPPLTRGAPACLRPTSSTRFARRSAGGAAGSARSTRPTSAPRPSPRIVDRTGIDPNAVEDVVFGCVDTVGGQAGDIARTCWLAAGLPEHVPGTTVDRQCGSAQQAVHFAAQAVMAGVQRRGRGGWRAADVDDPDQLGHDARRPPRLRRPVHRQRGLGEALRRRGGQPVPRRRDDRREVGHLTRGHGGVRGRVARAGHPSPRRRPLRSRDRAAGRPRPRRGAARAEPREDPLAAAAGRGRAPHRRGLEPDQRRVGGDAHRLRAGVEGPRPDAPRPASTT